MSELDRIVATTRQVLARRSEEFPAHVLLEQCEARRASGDERSFRDALGRPGLSVIAEHKRSSPSAGVIRSDLALADVVAAYQRGGAAALSILTEESRFDGALADLTAARAASSLPILRKDFIVDTYQVLEAYAAGADAILLIVAALTTNELRRLHLDATELGLDVLVEVHDRVELGLAAELEAPIIGINNRDLKTLDVDVGRALELRRLLPADTIAVAESGYSRHDQLVELAGAGVDAVLIGETLMRAADPGAALHDILGGSATRPL
jgi:indole-3-glycerol phosphate synthase